MRNLGKQKAVIHSFGKSVIKSHMFTHSNLIFHISSKQKMHSNTTSGFLNRFKRILMDNKNKYQGNESDSEVTNQCPQLSLNV